MGFEKNICFLSPADSRGPRGWNRDQVQGGSQVHLQLFGWYGAGMLSQYRKARRLPSHKSRSRCIISFCFCFCYNRIHLSRVWSFFDGGVQVPGQFDPSHPENYLSNIWNPLKYLSGQGLISSCSVAPLLYRIWLSETKAAARRTSTQTLPLLFILCNCYLITYRQTFELNMWRGWLAGSMWTVCFLI